jgi:hypothetical protein
MQTSPVILITSLALFMNGCKTSTLLSKETSEYGKLRFYVEQTGEQQKSVKKVYAAVDSSGIKIYYSFYPNRILKVKENENLVFTGSSLTEKGLIYQGISRLDSIVFAKAVLTLASLNLNWKSPGSTVAFIPEVLYYNGQPKSYKFRPL